MELKTGMRLRSVADGTEVIVVRAAGEVDLRCGGHPMVPHDQAVMPEGVLPGFEGETIIGKRYADQAVGIELLCTRAGRAGLSLGEAMLPVMGTKPLPASD